MQDGDRDLTEYGVAAALGIFSTALFKWLMPWVERMNDRREARLDHALKRDAEQYAQIVQECSDLRRQNLQLAVESAALLERQAALAKQSARDTAEIAELRDQLAKATKDGLDDGVRP